MTRPALTWLRRNLFSSPANTAATLVALAVTASVLWPVLRWSVLQAAIAGQSRTACTGDGACWTFISNRLPLLLFGHYPTDQLWRVALAALLLAAICVPLVRPGARHRGVALLLFAAYPVLAGFLLVGGVAGLDYIDPDRWGGLLLNAIITVLVSLLSLPLGTALAVGRRSPLPIVRSLCVGFIEFWRGVPLVGVLFVATVMLPLFLPQGVTTSRLLRAVLAMGLFNAAYIAEVVRGGLQGVPPEQEEAAASLGLQGWQHMLLITLPQALTLSIPGLVNTIIDLFKDTTLISIIGMYELLGTMLQSLRDPNWPGMAPEGFAFAAATFFVFCFAVSLYSRSIERRLGRHRR
jgi:general L-amino acid transport system permease protein